MESVGATLTTIEDAIGSSDLIVAAIPKDFYSSLPANLLAGRIVIDVSNRNSIKRKMEM